jgi:type 1 glutamine amidotransferase
MKKALLITDGIVHPPIWGRKILRKTLAQLNGFSFHPISSLEKLPADLEPFCALVLHYHHRKISERALKRLTDFVKKGGGVLAIHAATASFKKTLPYFEILGGRFIGHGSVERIKIRKVQDDIFENIPDFVIRDELYIHELQPGIEIHFSATHAGKEVPIVWTLHYGAGKVCYAMPGHNTGTMRNPTYQRILQRGLEWVTE